MALLEDKSMIGFIILVILICGLIVYIIHLLNNQINISNELNGIINKLDTDVNQEIQVIEDKITNINDKMEDNTIQAESLEDIKMSINSMKDKMGKTINNKMNDNKISESNIRECPECICNNQQIDEKALHDKIQANKVTCPNLEEIVRAVFPGRGTPGFTVYGEYVPIDENAEYTVEPAYSPYVNIVSDMETSEPILPNVGEILVKDNNIPLTGSKAPFDNVFDTADNQKLAERIITSEDTVHNKINDRSNKNELERNRQ